MNGFKLQETVSESVKRKVFINKILPKTSLPLEVYENYLSVYRSLKIWQVAYVIILWNNNLHGI